jgi:tetratricopeptide (TPR) repeat protein
MVQNEQFHRSSRAVDWSVSLSSRQRVLLHAQPIMQMRQSWSGRDDEDLRYDPMCLTMKLFDVVIDQSGFGNEVVRETVADALFPLLEALDEAAEAAPDRVRHRRVVQRLLGGLLNEANHNQSFAVDYSDFDGAGRASRKTFAFKLLKEVHGYSGEIALQLSSEAINLFLNALDLDIESEQIANEAVVQYQLERGKYDKARASAENARGQSLRYEEKIHRIIEQTKRDIRQVDWREEVHNLLVDALQHVHQRLRIEDDIIRAAGARLDAMDEGDQKRLAVSDVVRLMKDCRFRHLNLNKVLMSARGEFLEQQARQCFVDASVRVAIHLRDEVLGRLLAAGRDQVVGLTERSVHSLLGPRAPQVLDLHDLVLWQLQPRRAYTPGESWEDGLQLTDTDAEACRFDSDAMDGAAKVFAQIDEPVRLSELLDSLEQDGCPAVVQDAVILQVLEGFDPEDEARSTFFTVARSGQDALTTARCHGDDLWIEPVEAGA